MPALPTFGPRAELSGPLIGAIEHHYDLGLISACTDLGGAYNLNVRIDTQRGAYVARVYRPWVDRDRLLAIQQVRRHLSAADVPLALPLAAASGDTIVSFGRRLLEVEPYIPHDTVPESWSAYRMAFAFLGGLHTRLVQITTAAELLPPVVENYTDPSALIGLIETTGKRIVKEAHPQRAVALRTCDVASDVLRLIEPWWQKTEQKLPHQIVHGDFGPGNLLVLNRQVVGLVDLEFLSFHERLFDVAYAAYWMMARVEAGVDVPQRSWSRVEEMIAQYSRSNVTPLSDVEYRAITFEMARVPLHWIGEASVLANPVEIVADREQEVALAAWIAAHPSAILST